MKHVDFSFRRSRGVVWVCDIRGSSKLLNDNSTAGLLETFLPRFHWLGLTAVEALGGTFVKWTGDGFLAWFETPLHRDLEKLIGSLLEAITQVTFTVNVTQLSVKADAKVRIRHALTFEHDALLTTMRHADNHESVDVTGRAVVLAFRLSGLLTLYPNVAVDRSVAQAAKSSSYKYVGLKPWKPTAEDLLRHFKGERWGTTGLMVSCEKKHRNKSIKRLVSHSKRLVARVEDPKAVAVHPSSFVVKYTSALASGPDWARLTLDQENKFIKEGLLGSLKEVTALMAQHLENAAQHGAQADGPAKRGPAA